MNNIRQSSIGIFDSGYGGLTVFKSIQQHLPQYNYIYLGDNARSPYGDHSFDTVYQYTLEGVEWLFAQGCPLVILACNTASAKALKNIQQLVLPVKYPRHRVLGVIRPTAEVIGRFSRSRHIGVMGTRGTIASNSYLMEINKFFPKLKVYQQSCPLWVPLIENGEHLGKGADYFVEKYIKQLLTQNQTIDTILLACTHYPLLLPKIKQFVPHTISLITQGEIVASSLEDYLYRHPELVERTEATGQRSYFTTGEAAAFEEQASAFMEQYIKAEKIKL